MLRVVEAEVPAPVDLDEVLVVLALDSGLDDAVAADAVVPDELDPVVDDAVVAVLLDVDVV